MVELLESAESASCVAEIRLLEMHDKMDKMMVWMSTGQVDLTHCRTVQQ